MIKFRTKRINQKTYQLVSESGYFDTVYYLKHNPDVKEARMDPVIHYLRSGGFEGRNPSERFNSLFYLENYPDVIREGINPLVHFLLFGKKEGRQELPQPDVQIVKKPTSVEGEKSEPENARLNAEIRLIKESGLFNKDYYLMNNPDVEAKGFEPLVHYCRFGYKENRDPSEAFCTRFYFEKYPDVSRYGFNPLVHYIKFGKQEGRLARPLPSSLGYQHAGLDNEVNAETISDKYQEHSVDNIEIDLIEKSGYFNEVFYLTNYPDIKMAPISPIEHYYYQGWKENRNPGPEFDTTYYLESNPDVRLLDSNPLVHFIKYGKAEGRKCVYEYKPVYEPGSDFETAYSGNVDYSGSKVKLLAFYLPQFHPIPENDEWWGKGFTEWFNVVRAKPNFEGHYQPHLPVDLGFYDLRIPEVMKQQVDMAKDFGIGGFCFYYYWFDGKRLLEKPLDMFFDHKDWDTEYCVCWANENWTRRWDGLDKEILVSQNHTPEDDIAFIKDVSKYFHDKRYIRINGKPLLLIYRPDIFPEIKTSLMRWHEFATNELGYGITFAMVQTFGRFDPREYGFDFAVEFPPHNTSPLDITRSYQTDGFSGKILDCTKIIRDAKGKLASADYKLFRGVMLNWDNTARKGIKGDIYLNNTPYSYRNWLSEACYDTLSNASSDEEKIVFINAWNEWAEGTHLEPDEKYGYAYLNATARVLEEIQSLNSKVPANGKMLLVSHDAYFAGAQIVLRDILEWMIRHTSIKIKVIFIGDGELRGYFENLVACLFLSDYNNIGDTLDIISEFIDKDTNLIYMNSVASGKLIHTLSLLNIPIITHVHELQKSIEVYAHDFIYDVIEKTDHFIACSSAVKENLLNTYQLGIDKVSTVHAFVNNLITNKPSEDEKDKLKLALDIPLGKKIVLGMGLGLYWRKGADLFIDVCNHVNANFKQNEFVFLWIGGEFVDGNVKDYGDWNDHLQRIHALGLVDTIKFLGKKNNVRDYLKCGDVFLLPSREDPFPLVCLEAADCYLPVICFDKAGGMPEFVLDDAGYVIPFLDTKEMANKTIELLNNEPERVRRGKTAHDRFVALYSSNATIPKILSVIRKVTETNPLVTVIVPNYNYARYLQKRLDTIYNQTFRDFEVIILDDASTDNSLDVIAMYQNRPNTTIDLNNHNSGSVFHQWEKGVKMAKGKFIWIAEADDYSDPTFLENILPAFEHTDVKLAYCNSNAVDANGIVDENFYLNCGYYNGLGYNSARWQNDYFNNGLDEITKVLAIKNTIPNCSAVVFRKDCFLETDFSFLNHLKCSHDWLTYIQLIRSGRISYLSKTLNFHRRHNESVIAVNAGDYQKTVDEYFKSHRFILENFRIPSDVYSRMKAVVFKELIRIWNGVQENDLLKVYNTAILDDIYKNRAYPGKGAVVQP